MQLGKFLLVHTSLYRPYCLHCLIMPVQGPYFIVCLALVYFMFSVFYVEYTLVPCNLFMGKCVCAAPRVGENASSLLHTSVHIKVLTIKLLNLT